MHILEKISLTTVVLFLLGNWLLLKVIPSQPVFIGIFFLLVIAFAYIDARFSERRVLRVTMLGVVLLYILITTFASVIVGRSTGVYMVHDNALQIEASLKYLDEKKNPYVESYHNTIMGEWDHIYTVHGERLDNPALDHNLKLPFHIFFAWPFYKLVPEFDQRMVYFIVFLLGAVALYLIPRKTEAKMLLLTLFSLNPLFIEYFATGRDDVFVLTWLLWTFVLLQKKKYYLSALALGLALASKHSAWVVTPFYAWFLFLSFTQLQTSKRVIRIAKICFLAGGVFVLSILPFLIWNTPAFIEDIWLFPTGGLATSYPINGYSLASIMVSLGFLESPFVSFATWIPLLIIGVPIALWVFLQIKKNPTVANLVLGYALFMLVFWFCARFFHDNHIGFVSQLLLVGYFFAQEEVPKSEEIQVQ